MSVGAEEQKPQLPSWLSVPVLIGLIVSVLGLIVFIVANPGNALTAIALGLVPLVIVLPVLTWLDRVEPEPRASRLHALLWGATVAGPVSGLVNTVVAIGYGEVWALAVSAPLIEELTKALGIYLAVRRREVDGVMDGIVYAGWVGLGFAVIEDFQYFSASVGTGDLTTVFVMRALLTPFTHPLFTSWTGLAIGLAIARRQSILVNGLWGYGLAVACHATWNGSISYSSETGNGVVMLVAVAFFVGLFFASVVTVYRIRRHEQQRFTELAPILARRYGLTEGQVAVFGDWRRMLALRRSLPDGQRRSFDQLHAALARLALYQRRPGRAEDGDEAVLVSRLQTALNNQDLASALPR